METINTNPIQIEAGRTLQHYVDELPEQLHDHLVLFINGQEIDKAEWSHITTLNNDSVIFGVRPSGGDSGKGILGAIAAIAIGIIAPYAAGALVVQLQVLHSQ